MSNEMHQGASMDSSSEEEVGAGGGSSSRSKQKLKKEAGKSSIGKVRLTPTDPGWPKDVPDTFRTCEKDWRTEGILREEVSDQGLHELCWAISFRESIEAGLNIKAKQERRNPHPKLSAQHLVNNVKKIDNGAMRRYEGVTNFLVNEGLVTEDICQFTGLLKKGCDHATSNVTKIRGVKCIKKKDINEEDLIKLVAERPVIVEMRAYHSLIYFRGEGIYRGRNHKDEEKENRHALLLVGFGTIDGIHYWIVKNSFGTIWGDGGYAKVIRQCSPGNNNPSLFIKVRYPEV